MARLLAYQEYDSTALDERLGPGRGRGSRETRGSMATPGISPHISPHLPTSPMRGAPWPHRTYRPSPHARLPLLGEGEEDEPPILEELGINFSHIVSKTRAVLWPRRSKLDQEATDSAGCCGRHVHTTRP